MKRRWGNAGTPSHGVATDNSPRFQPWVCVPKINSFSQRLGEGGRRPDEANRELREPRERRIDADKFAAHTFRMAKKAVAKLISASIWLKLSSRFDI